MPFRLAIQVKMKVCASEKEMDIGRFFTMNEE